MTTAIDHGDGGLVELAMPPSAQLELAAQHDRYRQLLRSFLAWKRRAQTQCERRKRVAAACRVGAVFCQRLFWTKWRAFVAERRQLRREERTGNVQADAENQSQQEEKLDNGECIDLHNEETSAATPSSDEDIDQNKSKAKFLLGRRQLYKRWRLSIKKNEENSEARRVRSLHAIRRWRRFARMKKDRDALQQQAYFFLYYWLLKRSLNQLGRYALIKKRERTLIVKIVKANRHCLLVKTMQQWRLRLLSHQTFSLWRVYVRRRRHQALLYRPIADTLTPLRQRYRKKTRMALVHWKLTLQRKAFDGWKQYLQRKRMKQHRIHEALEFRHEQFVREGLRHWMTAALYLQEQREQQVARTQASNTTHVWHRVAAIARHWRYLAIRRRALKEKGQVLEMSRGAPRRVQGGMYWQSEYQQIGCTQHPKTSASQWNENTFKQANMVSDNTGRSNWTKEKSPLSEFVLLPRNRPQPRRPVEVLLFSQAETENLPRPNENTNMHEALRCGFDFPVEPFAPFTSPSKKKVKSASSPRKVPSSAIATVRERKTRQSLSPPTPATPPREDDGDVVLPNTTARQLDILERRLLALNQRKREWKISQEQLEVLREKAESKPRLMPNVRAMEEQHAIQTKRWLHTKERIRSLASEIQQLRRVLQT
ncbi:hypothetical protein PC110_g5220 [Phytophthora cactorum]|uniref:Uncharacterized protein n=1 Tax=Phytophthora cactorum TaxID=29920 RepID=A0A329SPM1_9STRA|nr:hypothetical protein PC110_g5220 [Phytophthora cactorum]